MLRSWDLCEFFTIQNGLPVDEPSIKVHVHVEHRLALGEPVVLGVCHGVVWFVTLTEMLHVTVRVPVPQDSQR